MMVAVMGLVPAAAGVYRVASPPLMARVLAVVANVAGRTVMSGPTGTTSVYRLAGRTFTARQLAVVAIVIALSGLLPRKAWRVGRLAVTAVHETGHAAVAVLAGREVTAVHLRSDSSGVTYHRGPRGWFSGTAIAAAGYPAPALAGLAGAWLTADRLPRAWLIALVVLGIINVLLWVRNLFGIALMVVWVVALGWLALYGSLSIDTLVGAAVAWYLLLGGLRAAYELFADRGPSDASDLGRLSHLPAGLFKTLFVLLSTAATLMGCGLLLRI
jgi:hypothetical protein